MTHTARHNAVVRPGRSAKIQLLACIAALAWQAAPASAKEELPQLDLSAQVVASVPNDEMRVVLAAERESPDNDSLGMVNAELLMRLQTALELAKRTPGVRSHLGSLATTPNWVDGKAQGWRVRGEIVLESRNFETLGLLAGQLATGLQLGSVQFHLSDEAQKAQTRTLVVRAAQAFQTKVLTAARALGFKRYEIKSVQFSQEGGMRPVPMLQMARRAGAEAAVSIPSEGGTSDLQVTVSGSVAMLK
ncbi:MAG: SIMPL domain-containing protein [Zoogloea sp.]|nr:SIMPL domain-containing protein [Zoogloea sp.]